MIVHDSVSHDEIMVNEADVDFRIPGLPHYVLKHAGEYQRPRIDPEHRDPPMSTRSSTRSTTESFI